MRCFRLSALAALALYALSSNAQDSSNQFTNPPASGTNSGTQTWTIGVNQQLSWTTNYSRLTLTLWSNYQESNGMYNVWTIADNIKAVETWNFTVGANIDISNSKSFHFEIYNGSYASSNSNTAFFASADFNITAPQGGTPTTIAQTITVSPTQRPGEGSTQTGTPVPSPTPGSSGLTSDAKIRIGVGIGLGIGLGIPILVAAGLAIGVFRRKKRAAKGGYNPAQAASYPDEAAAVGAWGANGQPYDGHVPEKDGQRVVGGPGGYYVDDRGTMKRVYGELDSAAGTTSERKELPGGLRRAPTARAELDAQADDPMRSHEFDPQGDDLLRAHEVEGSTVDPSSTRHSWHSGDDDNTVGSSLVPASRASEEERGAER